MVKLFVGGLPEGVDSIRLRQLFSQFVLVNECDVIKDYAFVHVADEDAARIAIEKLDGYILENKAINIRRSTSKLRREPGMDKRCYRCGSSEHKTPQCPQDPSLKRPNASVTIVGGGPDQKRLALDPLVAGGSPAYTPTIKIDLTGRNPDVGAAAATAGSYSYSQVQAPGQIAPPNSTTVDTDAELPRPHDRDLIPLYEQYLDSRTKYFYFRERLMKEVKVRAQLAPYNQASTLQAPYTSGVYNPYQQQPQTYSQQY
uniref:RRM domain-containing protein n=1 Tax=Syphacia muris TaxID=451379 RepID=A0A0N5AAI6_9BILA